MPLSRRPLLLAAAASLGLPRLALGAAPIQFGYSAVTDFASVFVAATEGFFRRRKLDIDLRFIPVNSTIPAALQSDALQIGGPTPSGFLQAVEGGLDLVAVAGGGVTAKDIVNTGLVARPGAGIVTAADCVGRKIGVPGLNAFLHITCRAWLKQQGVDHRRVQFVEVPFILQADLLRGGSLDATVTAEPFLTRLVDSGLAKVVSYYTTFLPDNRPTVLHVARRDWVQRNPEAVRAFREAVQEGAQFVRQPANEPRVRAALKQFLKLPAEVLAKVPITRPNATLTPDQLAYWVELMKDQDMLKTTPDVQRLIAK